MRVSREREIVLNIQTRIRREGTYSHIAVREALDEAQKEGLSAQQRAFIKRLAEGVTERQAELDAVIDAHTDRDGRKARIKPVIRDILRMGVYQILYMDSVPDAAACNEAVSLAKAKGKGQLAGFVNAVLRAVARENAASSAAGDMHGARKTAERSAAAAGLKDENTRGFLPAWIRELWLSQFTKEETDALTASMMEVRPVTIRLDERLGKEEQEEIISKIREAGVRVEPGRFLPYAFDLKGAAALQDLPGFKEGKWAVQDESSMMAAEAAGLSGGEIVYDLCAAPGGKSMHCAAKLAAINRGGAVFSFDLSPAKTALIRENAARMRLSDMVIAQRDARLPFPEGERERADVLLCDLPCSGLGVMGKKRDIKYRVRPEQLSELAALQKQILEAGITALKPGGTLIYSTCTIDRFENEEIASYIENELGLIPDPLAPHLPQSLLARSARGAAEEDREEKTRAAGSLRGHHLQLLPSVHGTDGFYIARFKKAL